MEIEIEDYKVTWEPIKENKTPFELERELEDIYPELTHPRAFTFKRLQRLIKKYPRNPQLRNHLCSAYQYAGKTELAEELNEKMLRLFPDYFFARVYKAQRLITEGRLDEVPEFMDEDFDLRKAFPNRTIYHISEFMAMNKTAVDYFIDREELDKAEERIQLMEKASEDDDLKYLRTKLMMKKAEVRFKRSREMRITPQVYFEGKDFPQPEFNFKLSEELYKYEVNIPEEILRQYLKLDRTKAIEDLQNILKYSYFNFTEEQSEEAQDAPLHAYFLLGEMHAEESLPTLLEMLSQTEEYLDVVFGDILTDGAWQTIFKVGKNKIPELEDFLKLPAKYTYARSLVADAVEQIYLRFPEKREEVLQIYQSLLTFYEQTPVEDNIIDNEFIALLVGDLVDLRLKQFLPVIKRLFEKGYVHPDVNGDYEDVERSMKEGRRKDKAEKPIQDIFALYQAIMKWSGNV